MTIKTTIERAAGGIARGGRRVWGAVRRHPWRTAFALPLAAVLYVGALYPFTPSIGDIKKAKLEQPTVVLSSDGKELAVYKRANRDWVKLSEISPHVVSALIATEDHRFFDHHGMDFKRTATALLNTLSGDRQGGSTITQQLARNLYPDQVGREATITRKIKEAITALKIEAVYTKEEILETYLNTVPFLYNAYGIEMAARTYFDKSAEKLDVVEAATLVGMLKGTAYYNPVLNPERSLDRRNTVLAQMVRRGKLPDGDYERLKARPLQVDFERQPEVTGPAPHMARQLRQWLIDWADRRGYNIYADGLVVRTTIDSRLQEMANDALRKQADRLQPLADARRGAVRGNKAMVEGFIRDSSEFRTAREQGRDEAEVLKALQADSAFMKKLWDSKTQLQAGFMAMEPGTGAIRAWVGSRDFNDDQFDHVTQARRQPGSTFKPFVYGAAFEQGASPFETLPDAPVEIRIDRNKVWRPTDVDPPTGQMMTLRDALAQSKNTVTAQLMQSVGPDRVAQLAQSMGVRQSKLELVPSLALGTSPVTLKEMVAAYGTIANSGNYVEPQLVLRIEDREGSVIEEFQPASAENALATEAAHTLLDTMRAVIDSGTAVRIRAGYGIKADVAGKTGTTQNDTDGWFIMMHPQLVAGAWVGFNDARITMVHDWGQGARSALPMVGEFYQAALRTKLIDGNAQFAAPRNKGLPDPSLMGRVGDWFGNLFGSSSPQPPERMPEVVVSEPTPLPQMPQQPALPSYPAPARQPDASVAGTEVYGAPGSGGGRVLEPASPGYAGGGTADGGSASILSLGLPRGRANLPPTSPGTAGSTAVPGASLGAGATSPAASASAGTYDSRGTSVGSSGTAITSSGSASSTSSVGGGNGSVSASTSSSSSTALPSTSGTYTRPPAAGTPLPDSRAPRATALGADSAVTSRPGPRPGTTTITLGGSAEGSAGIGGSGIREIAPAPAREAARAQPSGGGVADAPATASGSAFGSGPSAPAAEGLPTE